VQQLGWQQGMGIWEGGIRLSKVWMAEK